MPFLKMDLMLNQRLTLKLQMHWKKVLKMRLLAKRRSQVAKKRSQVAKKRSQVAKKSQVKKSQVAKKSQVTKKLKKVLP